MKHKFTILFCLVMFIYVSGFISGRLIKPFRSRDITKTEQIKDKIILQNKYKLESQSFIDSANSEMYNYSIRYYNLRSDILPDTYVSTSGEVIVYNKENFFKYYSKYRITDYLSKAKSSIINNLLIEKDTVKTVQFSNQFTKTSEQSKEIVSNSGWDASVYQVKDFLKNNLKDPDSYEGIEWSPVQKTSSGFMVRHKYRAKNSFGGYGIENKIFYFNPSGNIINYTDYLN